jgi:hypothetical protein
VTLRARRVILTQADATWFATPAGTPRHEFAWLPFGAGPRGCLGRQLGVMEAMLCSAYLLQLFDFEFEVLPRQGCWEAFCGTGLCQCRFRMGYLACFEPKSPKIIRLVPA